jgi:hypothetical protein
MKATKLTNGLGIVQGAKVIDVTPEEARDLGDISLVNAAVDERRRHVHGDAQEELHRRLRKQINWQHDHNFSAHHGIDTFGGRLYVFGNNEFTGVGGRIYHDLYPLLKRAGIEVVGFAQDKSGYSWIALTDLTDDNWQKMDRLFGKAFMKPFKGK